ncbi:SMC-Scp complex subunit ScpB [Dissulfurirhabdus thermomarina]|uniref:SMC-Scp complex subunit ScpB n=1 Tax=Dissulfurirhabdus thermomarina TaxID=1765737 RepID=A0A6N9TYH1_DISTH|nr:SMC-Scp complex subunit ScpB [Dissulfurirhabdus thermomarina]NDY43516.1 SMC-Scp complex subunit ScpB [Dissulfurirhabdus thermomarina]NMX22712.1 SMC-Scp complex subunit ScpB [Dissulfurirhabdus thermomarina]
MATQPLPSLDAVLDALFFVAERPLALAELVRILPEFPPAEIRAAIGRLEAKYGGESGVRLREAAGGWRLETRADLKDWVLRLKRVTPFRLSRAALETMALVAYRQPITRAEIEEIRGVDSSATLRLLLDRKLLRVAGRKEVPGRPILYATTRHFLEIFGLKDLAALPALADLDQEAVPDGEQPGLPLFRQEPPGGWD